MSKHTEGPWEATPYGDVLPTGANYLVASCSGKSGMYRNYEANARLIAAAPELLEAAKLVLAWYEAEKNHGTTDFYERIAMCKRSEDAIRAAISKATGG